MFITILKYMIFATHNFFFEKNSNFNIKISVIMKKDFKFHNKNKNTYV